MHATIHRFRRWPDEESQEWGGSLAAALHEGTRPVGFCVLGRIDGMDGAVLTFWDSPEEAAAAVVRTGQGSRWIEARAYRVVDEFTGISAAETPRFAQLVRFAADGDARRVEARYRADRERLWPAVEDIEGIVRTYVLLADDGSSVVAGLSTSIDTPETVRGAIMATELLPWEDPADLTAPDRVDVDRVLAARLPAEVRS